MLGKLLKYEFVKIGKTIPIIFGVIVVTCVISVSFMFSSNLASMGIGLILMALVMFALAGITLSVFLATAINFYKSLYSKEGYLTLTLPVKIKDIVIAKSIVSFFWISLSYVLIFGILGVMIKRLTTMSADIMDVETLTTLMPIYSLFSKETIVYYILSTIISILSIIGMMYFSISAGNLTNLNKHPVASSLSIYVLCSIVISTLSSGLSAVMPYYIQIKDGGFSVVASDIYAMVELQMQGITLMPIANIIVTICSIFAFFILNNYLMTKKLCVK